MARDETAPKMKVTARTTKRNPTSSAGPTSKAEPRTDIDPRPASANYDADPRPTDRPAPNFSPGS